MTYTLWSHGRLLATTDLAWTRWPPRHRAGDLQPTEIGETLLPVACGVAPALRLHGRDYGAPAVTAAIDASHALRLELRGPDGEIVPTEDLWIQDSEYLLAVAEETPLPDVDPDDPDAPIDDDLGLDAWDPEVDAMLAELPDLPDPSEEHDAEPAEEREWARFQVMLVLVDDSAVP